MDGLVWKQLGSTCCDHDGVNDSDDFPTLPQSFCNCINSARGSKHANFDDINTDIVDAGIYLFDDKVRGHMMNAGNPLSTLSSQSGGCSHGIAPMGSNHFLVSFQSAIRVSFEMRIWLRL